MVKRKTSKVSGVSSSANVSDVMNTNTHTISGTGAGAGTGSSGSPNKRKKKDKSRKKERRNKKKGAVIEAVGNGEFPPQGQEEGNVNGIKNGDGDSDGNGNGNGNGTINVNACSTSSSSSYSSGNDDADVKNSRISRRSAHFENENSEERGSENGGGDGDRDGNGDGNGDISAVEVDEKDKEHVSGEISVPDQNASLNGKIRDMLSLDLKEGLNEDTHEHENVTAASASASVVTGAGEREREDSGNDHHANDNITEQAQATMLEKNPLKQKPQEPDGDRSNDNDNENLANNETVANKNKNSNVIASASASTSASASASASIDSNNNGNGEQEEVESEIETESETETGAIEKLLAVPLHYVLRQTNKKSYLLSRIEASLLLQITTLSYELDALISMSVQAIERSQICHDFSHDISNFHVHQHSYPFPLVYLRPLHCLLHQHGTTIPQQVIQHVQDHLEQILVGQIPSIVQQLKQCAEQNWSVSHALASLDLGADTDIHMSTSTSTSTNSVHSNGGGSDADNMNVGTLGREKGLMAELEEEVCRRIEGIVKVCNDHCFMQQSTPLHEKKDTYEEDEQDEGEEDIRQHSAAAGGTKDANANANSDDRDDGIAIDGTHPASLSSKPKNIFDSCDSMENFCNSLFFQKRQNTQGQQDADGHGQDQNEMQHSNSHSPIHPTSNADNNRDRDHNGIRSSSSSRGYNDHDSHRHNVNMMTESIGDAAMALGMLA
eukprot:CAMPEP_0194127094 /NCGR_PEP_ID=MMETSP0150-20130528/60340_1 /TAXON_ID=122233 /ORGANISM="Chaetoceros debilis, Strain MM31A-1" /LENGTH=725 /DNA_ID=CAMNT_0038820997 /DNA_START=147 /DNA_END=2321 /DNA_ORIENTATION=-